MTEQRLARIEDRDREIEQLHDLLNRQLPGLVVLMVVTVV